MADWWASDVSYSRANGLVSWGLLAPCTAATEWLVPGNENVPSPPEGYVVTFALFHDRGFGMPHRFLRGLLHYYDLELQHLNPNGVQHIASFVALCEGFLGIEPHFELWRYFFTVTLVMVQKQPAPIGCASIHLRHECAVEYMPLRLTTSNRGWHRQWFHLKNDIAAPLPVFSDRTFEEAPAVCR